MEASTIEDVIYAGSTKDTAPQDIRQQTARHTSNRSKHNIIVNGGGWGGGGGGGDTQASTSPHTKHIASSPGADLGMLKGGGGGGGVKVVFDMRCKVST